MTSDDTLLFDRVMEQALRAETFDAFMEKHANAVSRGDWESVRLMDEMLRVAVVLGNHAVAAEQSKQNRT